LPPLPFHWSFSAMMRSFSAPRHVNTLMLAFHAVFRHAADTVFASFSLSIRRRSAAAAAMPLYAAAITTHAGYA
jgi:hypothetical protein